MDLLLVIDMQQAVIDHHHWIWANLICAHPVGSVAEAEILNDAAGTPDAGGPARA